MNHIATLTLSAALLLNGCASTDLNGQPSPTSSADIAKAIVGVIVVGGLIALAANMNGDDDPEETYVTSCGGGTCRTDVYR